MAMCTHFGHVTVTRPEHVTGPAFVPAGVFTPAGRRSRRIQRCASRLGSRGAEAKPAFGEQVQLAPRGLFVAGLGEDPGESAALSSKLPQRSGLLLRRTIRTVRARPPYTQWNET
jgi:hypothetical protein